MPVNRSYPELAETAAQSLPVASIDTLKDLRGQMCSQSASRDFKLQSHQRFLRRVLSPDSPVRGLLMVHGTGTGKTCSAIQIAEEYIIRPEFQDKRVLVLAHPAVQENFKTQLFDMSRVTVDEDGLLLSKQCTGRRYLDMLQRIQSEPMKWTDKVVRERMSGIAQRIISEFYEFEGYTSFSNMLDQQKLIGGKVHVDAWIHKTFDNRMIIVDEAHSLRDTSETGTTKLVSIALEQILKTANNVTLILLTATPMFHSFEEIIYYFDLFLWNDRLQLPSQSISRREIFTEGGDIRPESEAKFRGWCSDYISFIRGDNPMTFPFRLPPPPELIAQPDRTRDIKNRAIAPGNQRKVLTLTQSFVQGIQAEVLTSLKENTGFISNEVVCVLPENKSFRETFVSLSGEDSRFSYAPGVPAFLSPSKIADHSSKFSLITKIISESEGLIFVFSNLVEYGAQMFAMCLEEHGYESAIDQRLLKKTADEVPRGSKGKYMLFTSMTSDAELKRTLQRLKRPENMNGQDIKVIVASPKVSEGVDLRFIRQVHVLDYWYNMSRIEQVVGRGIRTCSHQLLPFEKQNCTVYLHVCRLPNSNRELLDEYIYRNYIETTATRIAKVKQVLIESAIDCPLQLEINSLPSEWRNLEITQVRSQGGTSVTLKLQDMASPEFSENVGVTCRVTESKVDPDHERPLSAYIDVRDEILDKLSSLFYKKPIWLRSELFTSPPLRSYDKNVIIYTIQNAIEHGFKIKNQTGEIGHIESKANYYAFALGARDVMQDRTLKKNIGEEVPLTRHAQDEQETKSSELETKRMEYNWAADAKDRFSIEVLDWYIVDHVLSPSERLEHMLSLDTSNLPVYAKNLRTNSLFVLGSGKIYNKKNEKITPIGDQADEYQGWVTERKNLYIQSKQNFFATMKEQTILFNIDHEAEDLRRADRTKNIGGRSCTSYPEGILNKFSEWLGTPFPKQVRTKIERCQYLSLLVRDAIVKKREGIVWWTPEEWSIFTEETNRKDLLLRLKA